jgi:hypothetical protein
MIEARRPPPTARMPTPIRRIQSGNGSPGTGFAFNSQIAMAMQAPPKKTNGALSRNPANAESRPPSSLLRRTLGGARPPCHVGNAVEPRRVAGPDQE